MRNDQIINIILPRINATACLPCYEFHISAECRARYAVDEGLFTTTGNVVLVNFRAAQLLAENINAKRDAKHHPDKAVRAGLLAAMGLVDELLHYVVAQYRAQKNPKVFAAALAHLKGTMSAAELEACLLEFVKTFPPLAVHLQNETAESYLKATSASIPNREIALEELLLLHLANANPGFSPFAELFDDSILKRTTKYEHLLTTVEEFFKSQPTFGPLNQSLVEMLKMPAKAAPHSLADQLNFIKEQWLGFLPGDILDKLFQRLLVALDVITEEEKMRGFGPGPAPVYDFSQAMVFGPRAGRPQFEPEQFTPDHDWMPEVVLLAKNTHVWLSQLSRKYDREIRTLDQVPDAELDILRSWGVNGLWLIGVWERSSASAKIKRICGNPEALSSAYSLYDYQIAHDLGGDGGYWDLKHRAAQRGLRIAVDMVPNHTGVFSRWVIEHPDWFVQLPYPPFPSYSFNGPDLSDDPNVVLQIEDGYWSKSDAAVVFKRYDKNSGDTRYIYHGNDGTHMPWNDTAQLNFLIPQVRQAVIGQILNVARYSSIIRFDAAMTLAKKHYQRLWFPEPGAGGDIPSRAGQGMSWQEFDRVFPQEFWREVVDRIAAESPQTLLLAEAFWLMEGYFVRTLGMHRVYNSAFMNMLKREENANYRQSVRNVLEFNPEILKRFVNFMNNPDEEPAAQQFGKGDKYFGVCLMMATMPGLPMFGHGQVEGFYEKYGMEYARSYWEEPVDQGLVERHQREIFPLLKRRSLFSEVENFLLYDVIDGDGNNQHDIFAFSNRKGSETALVVYNNSYYVHAGWVRNSVLFKPGAAASLQSRTLAEGLGLAGDGWYVFRDMIAGLEYLRTAEELRNQGLFVQLEGYRYNVFTDFRRWDDWSGELFALSQKLAGRGVPEIGLALWEMRLEPMLADFDRLTGADAIGNFAELIKGNDPGIFKQISVSVTEPLQNCAGHAALVFKAAAPQETLVADTTARLGDVGDFVLGNEIARLRMTRLFKRALSLLEEAKLPESLATADGTALLYCAALLPGLTELIPDHTARRVLADRLADNLTSAGRPQHQARAMTDLLRILFRLGVSDVAGWWDDPDVQQYLLCNWHNDIYWFNKERLQSLLYWRLIFVILDNQRHEAEQPYLSRKRLAACGRSIVDVMHAAEKAKYNYHVFKSLIT